MENISYVITIEDHDGTSWELDLFTETSVVKLAAARAIISDKAVIIKEQMNQHPEQNEWFYKARYSLKIAERNIIQIDRRIKQIQDPEGKEAFKRNKFQFYMGRTRKDFDFFIEYLQESHPEILNDILFEIENREKAA